MFRNQYDTDVTTWSPAGRLFQVEYSMEAVKQGSAAIGLRSKTHVVLACVNKANSELSSHQKKIFKVDDHIGVAIAGLTADGRVLSRYMRSECINYNFTYESPLPVGRLVVQLADKAQVCTQRSWKRPYGVGLLVAGLDESGAHLYYNCPSGNYFEYQAFAIGSRSQAAKTYLERRFENFMDSSRDDLVKDALIAVRETLQGESLKSSICTVAVVGVGEAFHILDQDTVQQLIDAFDIVGGSSMAKLKAPRRTLDSYTVKHINKTIKAGDCVLMRPSDPSKPSYVARIERIESDGRGANVRVHVRWYYRPEESIGGRRQFHGSKEVFLSDHFDIQSADTIEGKCLVHSFKSYTKLEAVGNEDFFCRFEYNSSTGAFNPDRVAV